MMMLKCRYARARIPAFINQELPINARRYVARHLDECPACRAQFEAQKTLRHTLMAEVPRLGQPTSGALENVWSRIAADLQAPAVPPPPRTPFRTAAYGFAAALFGLGMLLPLAAHFAPVDAQPRFFRSAPVVRTDTTSEAMLTASAQATQIAFVLNYKSSVEEYNTPELAEPATPEAAQTVQVTPRSQIQKP
jgi:anti-sigma factor RsiW